MESPSSSLSGSKLLEALLGGRLGCAVVTGPSTNPATTMVDEGADDWLEDCVPVDRKRLEIMIMRGVYGEDNKFSFQKLHGGGLNSAAPTAAEFFSQVSHETGAIVSWPTRLKIGAKTKKDPFVKLSGTHAQVQSAKEKICCVLRTKQSRVTLKIDVSFTDHSHIIGRQGVNTQKVMKETGCHIHFPDSNKNQEFEKSNQVSIAGPPDMVERARHLIRELSPLTITFELNNMRKDVNIQDLVNHPKLETATQTEGLHVLVRHNRSSGQPFALIRGSAHQEGLIKEAALRLMSLVFHSGQQVLCNTSMEILLPQQESVKGPGNSHIHAISQRTGAAIHFPDVSRNGATTFYIQGTLDAIIGARKFIIGCLPAYYVFDLKSEQVTDETYLSQMEIEHNLTINVKWKKTMDGKNCTIRCLESNLTAAYALRHALVTHGLTAPEDIAREPIITCPDYEFMSDMVSAAKFSHSAADSSSHSVTMDAMYKQLMATAAVQQQQNGPMSLLAAAGGASNPHLSALWQQYSSGVNNNQSDGNGDAAAVLRYFGSDSAYGGSAAEPGQPETVPLANGGSDKNKMSNYEKDLIVKVGHCSLSPVHHQYQSSQQQHSHTNNGDSLLDQPNITTLSPAPVTPVTSHLPAASKDGRIESSIATDLPETPLTTRMGGTGGSNNGKDPIPSDSPIAASLFNAEQRIRNESLDRAPGSGRKQLRFKDRDEAKTVATKKMQQYPSGMRYPSDSFSGLGFSKTLNESTLRKQFTHRTNTSNDNNNISGGGTQQHNYTANSTNNTTTNTINNDTSEMPLNNNDLDTDKGGDEEGLLSAGGKEEISQTFQQNDNEVDADDEPTWPIGVNASPLYDRRNFVATSYFESLPSSKRSEMDWMDAVEKVFEQKDIALILNELNLNKWIDIFIEQEIDYDMLLSLDEIDLREAGVTTAGARKKLLSCQKYLRSLEKGKDGLRLNVAE